MDSVDTATNGRDRARQRVQIAMTQRRWNVTDLARASVLDPGTVGDFLNGARWPQAKKRAAIEEALGWIPGSIAVIAAGGDPLAVQSVSIGTDDGPMLDLPPEATEGMSALQKRELRDAINAYALAKAREIRRDAG